MKKSEKTKKKHNPLALLVIFVLIAVVGIELVHVFGDLKTAAAEKNAAATQLENTLQENASLQADLDRADDPEIYKEKAREQLGLAEEGERIFYDVND